MKNKSKFGISIIENKTIKTKKIAFKNNPPINNVLT